MALPEDAAGGWNLKSSFLIYSESNRVSATEASISADKEIDEFDQIVRNLKEQNQKAKKELSSKLEAEIKSDAKDAPESDSSVDVDSKTEDIPEDSE